MRTALFGAAAALALGVLTGSAQAAPSVVGDYYEARSANLFIGACHHEGEYVTTGREAMAAWNVREGAFNGVSLAGVKAVAIISADKNLEHPQAKRRATLYVDAHATPAQREAMVAALREKYAPNLGEILAVKTAPITVETAKDSFRVAAEGVAQLKAKRNTERLCCIQTYETWGKPLISVTAPKVGYSTSTELKDSTLQTSYSGKGMNNTYFGQFSF